MKKLPRKNFVIGAFLASSALTAPAYAQQYLPPVDVPPVHSKVDQFNVDIVTRNIAAQVAGSISIGPDGPGGLKFIWTNSDRAGSDLNSGLSISGSTYSVYSAGATTTFTLNGVLGTGTFTNNQANGATLSYSSSTNQYTFTSANGTVLVLTSAGLPVTLTYPAGEQLTWNRDTGGTLRSVTTNLGYQYRPTFTGTPPNQYITGVVLFNMADETCDPLAVSCTLKNSWPTIDMVGQTVNGNPITQWTSTTNADGTTTVTAKIPITSTQNETLTYQEDTNGRVTSVTDGNGVWNYSYNIGGGVTFVNTGNGSSSDPSRQIRTVAWDTTTGLVTSDIRIPGNGASGDISNFSYDSYQRLSSIAHNGVTTAYTYDGNGNVTKTVTTDTNNANPITTSAVYPTSGCNTKTCNQPTSTTDANLNVTNYTYDPNSGGVASITYPSVTVPNVGSVSPVVTYNYSTYNETWMNGSGGIVSGSAVYRPQTISRCMTQATCSTTVNPNDQVLTTIAYDSSNGLQPSSVTTGTNGSASSVLQATTAYTYSAQGDTQTIVDPLSYTTWFSYDLDHRLAGTISPDPGNGQPMRASKVSYTSGGELDTMSMGTATAQSTGALSAMTVLQKSQATYNAQGLKSQDTIYDNTGAVGGVTQFSYTPERMLQCTAVRNNSSTWTSQSNACAQTSTNTDLITKTTYDDVGNVLTVRNGYTSDTQVPDMTNSWTDAAMLATQKDGNGNTTTYSYDTFNRRSSTCYPDSSTDCVKVTLYDANSNAKTVVNRAGQTFNLTYDALNRLTSKSGAVPTVSYAYDLLGRMLSASNSAMQVSFAYDALGRKTSETSSRGTNNYQYDITGRRTNLSTSQGLVLNYTWLATGDMNSILDGHNATLATFGYDALGNRSTLTYGNGTTTNYGYDSLYRLQSLTHFAGTSNAVTRTLGYNPASQITTAAGSSNAYVWKGAVNVNRSYTPNSLNQYASVAGVTFSYDGNGNLTSDGTNTFVYDAENHLTSATVGGMTTTLTYDPLGRLYQINKGSTVRNFIYDGSNVISEVDPNSVIANYAFGPGSDEPLVWWDGTAGFAQRMLHADERGSIVAISDSNGNPVTINSYDEYGIPGSGNSTSERFQYTGQMYLPEIGVYNYKARMYSPTLGRFMQTDPIGYRDGMNWYAYAHNDPVNGSDPTGLIDPGAIVITAAAVGISATTALALSVAQANSGATAPAVTPAQQRPDPNKAVPNANNCTKTARGVVCGEQADRIRKEQKCSREAWTETGVSFATDGISLIPAANELVGAGKAAAGAVGLVDSALTGDAEGQALSVTGNGLTGAEAAAKGGLFSKKVGEAIPAFGTFIAGLAVIHDIRQWNKIYSDCMARN